jgi:hypothetical protein
VSMVATPVGDGLNRPSQASLPGLAHHPPSTASRTLVVQREPEEVEGGRTFAAGLRCRRSPEGQEAGLVRMQSQSERPIRLPSTSITRLASS